MKPFEVVGIALACGAFVLLIVLLTIKDIVFALVFGGVAMVVVLIVLALLLLGYSPNPEVPAYLDREIPGYTNPGAHGATTAEGEDGASGSGASESGASEPASSESSSGAAEPDSGDSAEGK